MTVLTWDTKKPLRIEPITLEIVSTVYPRGNGYPFEMDSPCINQVILGDNLKVMSALMAEFEGSINLIYADPPFFTNRHYTTRIGQGEDSRRPKDWQLVEGYPDDWPDIGSYLDMLYPRLKLMFDLLAPNGTLYIHLDWHANSYARVLLDEIFGADRMLNEIIWLYHGPSPIKRAFNRKHDTILVYTKSKDYTFNVDNIRQPYDPNTVRTFKSSPKAGFGKIPNLERGKVPEDWWYYPVVARLHNERTGYPTQKPEGLLERIILASSNPGEIVADFFCGSGTTAVVAQRLGRKFIVCDDKWRAVHTSRKRLAINSIVPFHLVKDKRIRLSVHEIDTPDAISVDKNRFSLNTNGLPDLDYWEVDPNWNGKTFTSVGQAVRSRKKNPLRNNIFVSSTHLGNINNIRLVDLNGEQYQTIIG